MKYLLFASCPKGLEYLLEEELKLLGLHITEISPQGVYGEVFELATIYQLCLWSRLANRIQLILFTGNAHNDQSLHQLCLQFPWQTVFSVDKTLAIEFHGSSTHIRNSMFGAQVVKDGIVDHFRQFKNQRPSIDKVHPQIRLHAYLKNDFITVSFDLTGYSLHQRGYRTQANEAPLKENLAAALLMRAKWPQLATKGYGLYDPFCGSGTLVIEAAMMASHIAPGLIRQDQSLIHWAQHQPSLWDKVRTHALKQVKPLPFKLKGSDSDERAIQNAKANASRAGVLPLVEFEVLALENSKPQTPKGLLICNPPYGERMGEATHLIPLYNQLGVTLHDNFQEWEACVFTSNPLLAKAIGLRSEKQYTFYNGPIECKLYHFHINAQNRLKGQKQDSLSPQALMFANRLRKNVQHLQKWAHRNSISCYRVYDADIPEYAFAIDCYNDYALLQEYKAPAHIPQHKTEKRSLDVVQVVPKVLNIMPNQLIIKERKQQKGLNQYQKLKQTNHHLIVTEGAAKFKVNLYDYLDTGLFLDHRLLRLKFSKLEKGTRFLNCFCYTATASVHAALAGAITTNVDLSNTYLKWAEDNFKLNNLPLTHHQFIQFDVMEWLKLCRDRFDVIFFDPPSFSNSKRMKITLDIQRDQVFLIDAAMKLLKVGGSLYFSTNFRQFKLSSILSEKYSIRDITEETIDLDFKRNKKIHHCFLIQHK